ncbi:transcriptional regulator [Betaproteobacteria bacterium SCGC AG-212-J23]|nr:transcriptional regulator [Betaproteobacteria bacterium SCGC AG-212-J23]
MRIGVDVGGTKIEAIALDQGGRETFRKRVPTPRGDYQGTLDAIAGLVRDAGEGSVGIGIPGAMTGEVVKNANSNWLIGKPFKRDLERAIGREVRIENDANCFALSEAVDGPGRDAEIVFGVILGTGVGGGVVFRKTVLRGVNAIAGEWGHNPMPGEADGRACYCGRQDCIETYLCGPAFERDGRNLDRYHDRLARALGGVINILDPGVIVLGGGLSNLPSLYSEVPRLWGRYIFSNTVATRLVPPVYGDSSGVRGAAWLWNKPTTAP